MKKVIKHILFLCVLLLIGNSSLFAHTSAKTTLLTSSSEKITEETANQTNLENLFNNQTAVSDAVFETYHKKEILSSDNEEEDSETMTAKKVIEKQSSQLSFFKLQATSAFIAYTKKTPAFYKALSYLPSCNSLYIIFGVFRI